MKIHEKTRKGSNQKERFYYVNGDYKSVLWILVNLAPFLLEGILYLYNSCQIDKVRVSCSVWIPKSIIWLRIEPDAPIWINVKESPSLSDGSCSVTNKDELPSGVATLFELRLGLKIKISVVGSKSYVNYPTRL